MEPQQWGCCPAVLSVQALHVKQGRPTEQAPTAEKLNPPVCNLIHEKRDHKCAWKASESSFASEIWILQWNPGLVISFLLQHSKEAETRTNSYSIYLFGNICKSL